jgi:choline dehydrogenase-like flavoprotein
MKEGSDKFDWWRARMVGGRTNHWGRISLRFGPKDFKRRSIDGLGDDWPIGYEDVKPYYDKIDQLIGDQYKTYIPAGDQIIDVIPQEFTIPLMEGERCVIIQKELPIPPMGLMRFNPIPPVLAIPQPGTKRYTAIPQATTTLPMVFLRFLAILRAILIPQTGRGRFLAIPPALAILP